jgi:hypothetical protein
MMKLRSSARHATTSREVEVHDVSEGIASATVRSALYVDLLQLLKTRDGWRIVNVAWRDR